MKIGFQDEPTEVSYYYAPAENDLDDDIMAGGSGVYNAELGLFGLYDLGDTVKELEDDEG